METILEKFEVLGNWKVKERKVKNMIKESEISIGIDLGIASVGWSVVDLKNNEILDKGVYLFEEAQKAEDRRNARGVRRRKKRKNHRIERIYQVLENKNIMLKNNYESKLLEIRNKAIKEKVEMQDIVNILFYFARHRGYIPFKDEDERKSEIVDKLREKGYIACEIQKEVLDTYNKYRGDEFLLQHSDFEKELKIMLNEQRKYYLEIDDEFIEKIMDIINSKRKFWEGPGGPREDQLNKYGRYKTLEDLEKYKLDKNYNKYLFEELIGNCKIYKSEKKASSWNFYAECFNFYNDIVNLRIDIQNIEETSRKYFEPISKETYKLKRESIALLKEEILKSKTVSYPSLFKKQFNVDFEYIYGYKKDKDGNAEIAKFEKIRYIKNKIENQDKCQQLLSDMDAYNRAMYLIQVSPDKDTRLEVLRDNVGNYYDEEILTVLANCKLDNRYHNFSEKALKKYLELMEEYNENSSYIERNFSKEIASDVEMDLIKNYINDSAQKGNLKYINSKYIDVRIDIWTHFMRGCIMKLCTPI